MHVSHDLKVPAAAGRPRLGMAGALARLGLIGAALAAVAGTFAYLGGWLTPTVVTGTALVFGSWRELPHATGKAPPIPKAGPLARPRSLDQVGLPAERTRTVIPRDNPQTPEKITLGQKLFFDGRLSVDGTVACATCHDPAHAFTDGRPVSVGIHGRAGQRNAPTILNGLYKKTQFWDGRAKTLEDQAAFPIVNSFEMGQPTLDAAVDKIAGIEEYRRGFQKAFGRPVKGTDLVRAIAAYERTLVSFDSPFDHFIAGDKNVIDEAAKQGRELFNTKARCNKCHALTETKQDLTNFTDFDFHNIGIGIIRQSEGRGQCRHPDGLLGARALPHHQERGRYRRFQDAELAERAGDRAVLSRRFTTDSLGCR
jgi:cytochrome c peroxidase